MKKEKKNKKIFYGKANYNEEMVRGIKIFLCVALLFAAIYFVTALLTGEISFGKKEEKETVTTIQYEEILAGESFNRSDKEYYILYFPFTDGASSLYITLKDAYAEKEKSLPVYIVDLDKYFNTSIVAKDDETFKDKPQNIGELKVKNATLLKFSDRKVVSRIEGKDNIKKAFEDLLK